MPKIAPLSSPTKKGQPKSPSKSPRKKKVQPDHEEDRLQWRASRIADDATINKTAACANYHIGANALAVLTFKSEQTVVKIDGCDTIMPKYMYKEKEVEMLAWDAHGGPIGFERMLDDKEAKFRAKHGPGKQFPRPSRYYPSKATGGPMSYVTITPASQRHIPDPETSTPGLINMKAAFAQKNAEWLWDAINQAIRDEWELTGSGSEPRGKPREAVVQGALAQVVAGDLEYPERPEVSPPESISFRGLLATLAEAPIHDPSHEGVPGIEIHDDCVTGCRSAYWHSPYVAKVYACLTDVIHEHGLDGWAQARWLVYDKYVQCKIGGLGYHWSDYGEQWAWSDTASFWLDGAESGGDLFPVKEYESYRLALQEIGAFKR